jgi:hypothetical protein
MGVAPATADKLMSLLETGWANRRPRTARKQVTEPATSHVDANRAPQGTVEPTLAPTNTETVSNPSAAGISMGQIEDLLRKLLEEERSKDRERERERAYPLDNRQLLVELQEARERVDRQEAALRQRDELLRRMREEQRGPYEASPGPSNPRETSGIRASDNYGYGRARGLGGGYREAAARARERAAINEREPPTHCMSTGKDFGMTAVLGDAKFNVALPPKFNPDKDAWMLWKPQVFGYFDMINLEGILDPIEGRKYSLQVNKYVIGALQQISPQSDAAWMSSLQLKWGHQAWEQLEKAYGSRAELDLQQKMYDFECAAQRPNESIREWTVRLERQVTELNVMAKEAAKLNIAGYNESRDVAVYASSHKFSLLHVLIEEQSQEAFMATLRVKLHEMSVSEVESALITYEQGRKVQRALAGATGSTRQMYQMDTRRHKVCYACDGVGHAWQCCREAVTEKGAAKLAAKGIKVPKDFKPRPKRPEEYYARPPRGGKHFPKGQGRPHRPPAEGGEYKGGDLK